MIELLRRVSEADPGRAAVVTHDRVVTYRELVRRADAAAAAIRRSDVARFAIVDHEADIVVPLVAAAAAAGAEACLYPPAEAEEIAELLQRFDHRVVVTDRSDVDARHVLPPSAWIEGGAEGRHKDVVPTSRPHLVLTTGTTGTPRGVRHDWDRLLGATGRIDPEPDQRWLLAYGLHQFAGLQILLHVFAAGATLVAPAPRRPREGLRAIRELGVTHASATPTYWRFLLAEMRADRGVAIDLEQITLGGEAVPGPLLEDLRRTFPATRLSQVYAASEFGSTGSVRDGLPGLAAEVLQRNEDAPVALKIVDGELWIRSRVGMLGYYGEAPLDPDAWRPTGDLVEERDGRVVFLGRTSEIINVGGVKVHPLPIEARVSAVVGVDLARVYGRANPMTGQIVALEIVPAEGADVSVVDAAVRAATLDLPSASRPRSIRFVESIDTLGSKIVRSTDGQ